MLTAVYKFTLSSPSITVLKNINGIAYTVIRGFHTQWKTDNLFATALKVIYCLVANFQIEMAYRWQFQ
jgi:hypothetical protein